VGKSSVKSASVSTWHGSEGMKWFLELQATFGSYEKRRVRCAG